MKHCHLALKCVIYKYLPKKYIRLWKTTELVNLHQTRRINNITLIIIVNIIIKKYIIIILLLMFYCCYVFELKTIQGETLPPSVQNYQKFEAMLFCK